MDMLKMYYIPFFFFFFLQWVSMSLVFKEAIAEEATTYCDAYPTECNLHSKLVLCTGL